MDEKKVVLLLANERTGSTATYRLIGGHPEICFSPSDGRIFTDAFNWEGLFEATWVEKLPFDVQEIYQHFDEEILCAFITFMANKNPYKPDKNVKVYGMKCTFYESSRPILVNMVDILKKTNRGVQVIHLTRDYDESFISWLIDRKTGRGKDRTDNDKLETHQTRVRYTEEKKQEYILAAKERDEIIQSLADHISFLPIHYNALYSNVEQGAKAIFEFLNVSTSKDAIDKSIQSLNRRPKRLTMPLEHYIEN